MKAPIPFLATAWVIAILISGCARIVYQRAGNPDNGHGIRFYQSSPYLLVYPNGKGGLVTQLLFIADPSKKMEAIPRTFMASAQATMEFDRGVYRNAKSSLDATALPVTLAKAIQSALPAFLAAANDPGAALGVKQMPAPHLYKIIVHGTTVEFIGGPGDTPVSVNVLSQPEKKK